MESVISNPEERHKLESRQQEISQSEMPKVNRRMLVYLICLYVVLMLGISMITYYHEVFSKPYLVNDDALSQIFCFYKVGDRSFYEVSDLAKFFLDLWPVGYKTLYKLANKLGYEPLVFSKILTFLLLLSSLFWAFAIGYNQGGITGGVLLFTLVFISEGFFERMAGGLSRAFGYPIAFMFCYGVVSLKLPIMVSALLISTLFYPPLSPFMAAYIAIAFIFPYKVNLISLGHLSLKKRFLLLMFLGGICVVFVLSPVMNGRIWGSMYTPKEISRIKEMMRGGRYDPMDRTPSPSILNAADFSIHKVFRIFRQDKYKVLDFYEGAFVLFSMLPFALEKYSSIAPVSILWLVLVVIYEVSARVYPYLYIPTRYTLYFIPIFILIGIAIITKKALTAIKTKLKTNDYIISVAAVCVIFFIGLSYVPSMRAGFVYDFQPISHLYQTIQQLPKDAFIAGWPDPVLDAVPLFGHRPILVGYETYQLFYRRYLRLVRSRMSDLLKILFSEDEEEFLRITRKYGINYLIYPDYIYKGNCKQLRIFTPFTQVAQRLCSKTHHPVILSLGKIIWTGRGYKLVRIR